MDFYFISFYLFKMFLKHCLLQIHCKKRSYPGELLCKYMTFEYICPWRVVRRKISVNMSLLSFDGIELKGPSVTSVTEIPGTRDSWNMYSSSN